MTGVDSWSVTPATNATADGGAINWAENQAPSTVNNTARQMLADIRSRENDLIWFQYGSGDQGAGNLAVPCVYASGTTFTIAGVNVTAAFHVGRRVRAVGVSTGTIYGTIASSAFSTNTTVTAQWDSGSLSNETLVISVSQISATGDPVSPAAITRNAFTKMASDAPTGTTSATTVQMGLGSIWVLTPKWTGRVRIRVSGWATNTAVVNTAINATYGTGTAPVNGAAKTGTYFSTADIIATGAVGAPALPCSFEYEASGLTIGTAYWFDLTLTSDGAGTAIARSTGVIIEEVP